MNELELLVLKIIEEQIIGRNFDCARKLTNDFIEVTENERKRNTDSV